MYLDGNLLGNVDGNVVGNFESLEISMQIYFGNLDGNLV